ncbi:TPA: AlpA family phage regulatory protein [Stenotrophomonas maltophilia]|nr:AlpA family phage regulatory protein [Stenotrophomonas maltophilia]ELK6804924.1 AlpA family phage regulatory protein [Stenotrophomonas maltophilia]HDS1582728.1 AlpA family phage regulatory protein [Stenotrophomonas maltophilia]HDS1596640.1 AlpA family phage regulatory protein [Stenotrophomonas maltophilia]
MGAAENIPEVLLKLEQVEAQTGMNKSYIYREMGKGTFPPRHKVGGGTRWYQSDIQRWIRARRSAPQWTSEDVGRPAANCDSSGA